MYSVSTCLTRSILVGGSLCVGIGSMVWGSEEQAPIVNVTVSRAKPEVGPDGVSYVVVKPDTQGIDVVIPLGGLEKHCSRVSEQTFVVRHFRDGSWSDKAALIEIVVNKGRRGRIEQSEANVEADYKSDYRVALPTNFPIARSKQFLDILHKAVITTGDEMMYRKHVPGLCGGSAQGDCISSNPNKSDSTSSYNMTSHASVVKNMRPLSLAHTKLLWSDAAAIEQIVLFGGLEDKTRLALLALSDKTLCFAYIGQQCTMVEGELDGQQVVQKRLLRLPLEVQFPLFNTAMNLFPVDTSRALICFPSQQKVAYVVGIKLADSGQKKSRFLGIECMSDSVPSYPFVIGGGAVALLGAYALSLLLKDASPRTAHTVASAALYTVCVGGGLATMVHQWRKR